MSFLQDILPIFKKRNLTLLESRQEAEHVYTFLFDKEKDVTWKAGQHGLFTITHKSIKNGTRPFTVASAPSEKVIQITIGIDDNPSDFKKAMLEMKPGMNISMTGPVGSFYLQDNRPALLIAGGIGVTPFRSIFKQLEAEGNGGGNPIHLLYMDSKKSYLFKDELDETAGKTSARVTYLDSREDLHQEIDTFAAINNNNGKYLISGSKSMVESIFTYLQNQQISKRNIKKDVFFGYA